MATSPSRLSSRSKASLRSFRRRPWPDRAVCLYEIESPAHSRAFLLFWKVAKLYRATRSFAISVPICANAVVIWLGWVSMKKLFEPLAQLGRTADWPAPSVKRMMIR
jgi:hypothetical protein